MNAWLQEAPIPDYIQRRLVAFRRYSSMMRDEVLSLREENIRLEAENFQMRAKIVKLRGRKEVGI